MSDQDHRREAEQTADEQRAIHPDEAEGSAAFSSGSS